MTDRHHVLQEMADFLVSRRHQVDLNRAGVSSAGRRRTPGLRREEVSVLSGVSLTWYTWLEQARDINPSRQVLDALSTALQLTAAEHRYLLGLAGFTEDGLPERATSLPDHGQSLLDAFDFAPAYAITDTWDIVGWNRAYEVLYPGVATAPPHDRNLLWLVFTDPTVRGLLDDWETDSQRFLAHYRSEAGARITEPKHTELVSRLTQDSELFRTTWQTHAVDGFTSRARRFHHPTAGHLTFEHHRLSFDDDPRLHLITYTAPPGSSTHTAFTALLRSTKDSRTRPRTATPAADEAPCPPRAGQPQTGPDEEVTRTLGTGQPALSCRRTSPDPNATTVARRNLPRIDSSDPSRLPR